ncbi:hypothetical protein EJ110_NYTH17895 [Nymphaea thermarum]|nr:hypothetical protein EJ110_NYTH17895 [Nymphaea thermarum]
MSFCPQAFMWVFLVMYQMPKCATVLGSSCCAIPPIQRQEKAFQRKADKFYVFEEQSNGWKEVQLPFDLYNCLNGNCTKAGSIEQQREGGASSKKKDENSKFDGGPHTEENIDPVLQLRRRTSITKMSESSVWVTGESGSIYERFWNGLQWVITPHDLPISAHAISVFIVNQTILALDDDGVLHKLQLNENSLPTWGELKPIFESIMPEREVEPIAGMQIKTGVVTENGERLYLSTLGGLLLEIRDLQSSRWIYHGQPPGGSIAAIAGIPTTRTDIVFIVSYMGELYEFDMSSKPSWKKHIWSEPLGHETFLLPCGGHVMHGLVGAHSLSIFLLTKDGVLIERRLHQRKWKWIIHGLPRGHKLSAITPATSNDLSTKFFSLFLTTTSGSIYEYRISKNSVARQGQDNPTSEAWINHMHPPHAKVARGILGLQLQPGRMLFPLDDGRVGELHLSGIGGHSVGPNNHANARRKTSSKYEWSIIDAPETEGWNAEYCTEGRGPSNCITGIKDLVNEQELDDPGKITRRRKNQEYQSYIMPIKYTNSQPDVSDQNNFLIKKIQPIFRMRSMHPDKSFFLVTDNGITFEYLYTEGIWLWLRHEHPTPMKGILGIYNGSLFLVDMHGSLLIRERNSNGLAWINCTSMSRGRKVSTGPPWDGVPGKVQVPTTEDSLFFINKNGRLLQFKVALRKFVWKDCRNPQNIKVSSIVDQEGLRSNIVFAVGSNGRLYQFNKVTELWHEHDQSPHLSLSRLPGMVLRPSSSSLSGSLFMRSEDGGLVEYRWNPLDGWNWMEHGTPHKDVIVAAAPGPSFQGSQLFIIGSDGHVYLRYLVDSAWRWQNYGFPSMENLESESDDVLVGNSEATVVSNQNMMHDCNDEDSKCNPKVAPVRPIPFSDEAAIFELRDGRLGELRRTGETQWSWSRIINTPTSQCRAAYLTVSAS